MLHKSISQNLGMSNHICIQHKQSINIHNVRAFTTESLGETVGYFRESSLKSVFQPIFSLAHQRSVGYEALARVVDQYGVVSNPVDLYNSLEDDYSITQLDRICRYIHLKRFCQFEDKDTWLFLNITPQVIVNGKRFGSFFEDLLTEMDFPAHRIVIEIVEHPAFELEQLQESVEYYQNLGCLIAIDDFGAGHSNFERIWSLKPNIVKLDRSMIFQAAAQNNIRQLLPGIVTLLHQAGALVLIEGVETEDQAMIAMESGADFVQGYFFSKPLSTIDLDFHLSGKFEKLFKDYQGKIKQTAKNNKRFVGGFIKEFSKAVELIKSGKSLKDAGEELFVNESIVRMYMLRPDGIQIGETIHPQSLNHSYNPKFKPIQFAESANWFRRHYLQRAVLHPGQIQISRPYLSITGAHMCITMSVMFEVANKECVLCCDINLE